jgi:hypothetical protein
LRDTIQNSEEAEKYKAVCLTKYPLANEFGGGNTPHPGPPETLPASPAIADSNSSV